MAMPSFTFGGNGSVGDLIGGSWRVTEATPAVDILDTSGEISNISAAFKRISQTAGNTPASAPAAASEFVQGQSCTFTHPSLGTYNAYVSGTTPQGGTISLDILSRGNILNVEMSMPAFADGASFYSWSRKVIDGSISNAQIYDMTVSPAGNIWVTGGSTGSDSSTLYDRFGNYIMGLSHSYSGLAIRLDSSGNIYVLSSLRVEKFNSSGVSQGIIITSGAGSFAKMAIDSSDNIYIATTDTTSNSAIKKYSSTGTFISSFLTYNSVGSFPTTNLVGNYTGMNWRPVNANGHPELLIAYTGSNATLIGHTYYGMIQWDLTTNALLVDNLLGTPDQEWSQVGLDYTPTPTIDAGLGNKIIYATQTGLQQIFGTPQKRNYTNVKIFPRVERSRPDSDVYRKWYAHGSATLATIPPYSNLAYTADKNGSGYWFGYQNKVYRVAGGYLGPNQAIECYLGAAGFTGTIEYGPGFSYADGAASLVDFPAWTGNVWSRLKELSSRVNRGINTTPTGIYIYHTDSRTDQIKFDISDREVSPNIQVGDMGAQVINVTSHNVARGPGGRTLLKIPDPGDSTIEVAVGRVTFATIQANANATAIEQPSYISTIFSGSGPYVPNDTGSSKYYITDSTDISAGGPKLVVADWLKYGGNLEAYPSDTDGSIDLILTGPQVEIPGYKGPYRLGYMLGGSSGNFVPWYCLYGQGVTTRDSSFSVLTGVPVPLASSLRSQSIDSPFIDSESAGYDMARISSGNMISGGVSLTVKIPITSAMSFGKVAGGYFFYNRNMWRIIKADYEAGWVTLSAQRDTRYSEAQPSGLTYAQGNTLWSNFRYIDNYLSPGVNGA